MGLALSLIRKIKAQNIRNNIWIRITPGHLVQRLRVSLWSERSEVQILGWSNWIQCWQRLATAATFLQKKLCCQGSMSRKWAPPTRYTLRHITVQRVQLKIWFETIQTRIARRNSYYKLLVFNFFKWKFDATAFAGPVFSANFWWCYLLM